MFSIVIIRMAARKRSTRSAEVPDVDFPPFDPGIWAGSDHWTQRNVYTKTLFNVTNLLESMYKEFILIWKIFLK